MYKAGEEILRRGSTERSLYHILSGRTACLSVTGQVAEYSNSASARIQAIHSSSIGCGWSNAGGEVINNRPSFNW